MKKNILVIDDSALMRRAISDIINQTEEYRVVSTASNGEEGLNLIHRLPRIDIIFLDIHMPVMDGIELLKIMKKEKQNIPTVVFSSLSEESDSATIEALSLGAVEFVKKPEGLEGLKGKIYHILSVLEDMEDRTPVSVKGKTAKPAPRRKAGRGKLVALACSTGGPRALQEVIPLLPVNLAAPVLVVQHMPEGFTASLANRLNEISQIAVKEAADGDILEDGQVYIAKGGKHMRIAQERENHRITLGEDAPVNGLRPYANYMYESLVYSDYHEIICVVLTGMGADGTRGIGKLRRAKNIYVIAQDQSSSTVYGMPKMIVQAGLANEIVSLDHIAEAITKITGVC